MPTPAAWYTAAQAVLEREQRIPPPAADPWASPCLFCGLDDDERPYADTEEHRSTSEHQWAVLTS